MPPGCWDLFSPGNSVFPCSLLCLYVILRGEMEIGGELVVLEIRVIPKEGQSARRVF